VKEGDIVAYYSRDDVAEELTRFAQSREVAGRFADGRYSSRPGTLFYPGDVKRMASTGIVSFHASVELWENPLQLETSERSGWDFLIDLDGDKLEHSRKVAEVLLQLLEAHGIESVHLKFSGRAGFHIFIPWKAFDSSISHGFPEIPRAIGRYLEDYVRNLKEDLTKEERFGVHIDSIAIASRHLMRMPYSLNEKSWLVSIPVDDPWFDLENAKPDNVVMKPFMLDAKPGEAMSLVDLATDFVKRREKRVRVPRERPKGKVPEEFFAPCIKNILKGLSDGRKRAEFILRAYLSNVGWNWDEIEEFILKWNKKNRPPVRESYLKGQIRWHRRQKKNVLPPNHESAGFYKDMGVLSPECSGFKNPLSYTFRRYRAHLRYAKRQEATAPKGKSGTAKKEKGST
jgi:DNA primase